MRNQIKLDRRLHHEKDDLCFLALLLLAFCAVPAFAADGGITVLQINPYGGDEADIDTVKWFASSGKYFLFLPADTDLSAAKVYFTASNDVTLDGAPVVSGESAAAFTEGEHTLVCGSRSYPLTVMLSANIPAVYLTTESGSLDYIHASKENKEPGSIRVYENGVKTTDSALKQIKGRGNWTWTYYAKKPYNIKYDKKTSLLGMPKAKKWTMLANWVDPASLHNPFAWCFAEKFGLPYTSEYRHADVYINGEYKGIYTICESVEVADNRVEINDLEKANENANPGVDLDTLPNVGTGENGAVESGLTPGARKWIDIPNDPADISGGYLLEFDWNTRYDEELCGFVAHTGQPVVIKSPEHATQAEVNYIADLVDPGLEAIHAPTGYNAAGKHYSEYFDMDSLVTMYILQELGMNHDTGVSSLFFYKSENGDKIVCAPIWDMDNAFGLKSYQYTMYMSDPTQWYSNNMSFSWGQLFHVLYGHADFRAAVSEKWSTFRTAGIFEDAVTEMTALSYQIADSCKCDVIRWNRFGTGNPVTAATKWRAEADHSLNYTADRAVCLDKGFAPDGAILRYETVRAAPTWRFMGKSPIVSIGESEPVQDIANMNFSTGTLVLDDDDLIFYGWNTKPDYTGTIYKVGDTITLTENLVTMYSMFLTEEEIDAIEAAAQLAVDKAAFEAAKADALAAAAAKARPGDSAASQNLIAQAKAAITALTYDETHTLAQNKTEIQSILTALDTALAAQREADAAAQNPGPSENGNNDSDGDYLQWLRQILQMIINFWRRVFRIK